VLVLEGDQVAVERYPMDERLGAVDGVEDPGTAARSRCVGLLFTDDAVVGMGGPDVFPEQPFGAPVGRGDGCAVVLAVDVEVGVSEVAEGEGTGIPGDGHGEVDEGGVDRWAGVVAHGRSA